MKPRFISFILLLHSGLLFSQTDSLKKLLAGNLQDTTRLKILIEISELCNDQEILSYTQPALILVQKLLDEGNYNATRKEWLLDKKAYAHINTGYVYDKQGKAAQALDQYRQAVKIFLETSNKAGIANSMNNMGAIYDSQGDISRALNCYEIALTLFEAVGMKEGMAYTLNNIGAVYDMQGHTEKALEYHGRSLKINEETGDKRGMALLLNNIGLIYYSQGKINEALELYRRGLKIQEELDDLWGTALLLNNIGLCYYALGDINRSLEYHFLSMKQKKQIADQAGVSSSMNNIATILHTVKKNKEGKAYADSALKIATELGFPEHIANAAKTLSRIDSSLGDMTGAFVHYKLHVRYRDSIANQQTRRATTRNQLKYEFDKKTAVLKEQQEKERALASQRSRVQQIIIWSVAGGLLLVLAFAVFVVRSLRTTRRQKQIIEEKQKEILDSIYYARRIQTALLTNEKYINKHLKKIQVKNSSPQ